MRKEVSRTFDTHLVHLYDARELVVRFTMALPENMALRLPGGRFVWQRHPQTLGVSIGEPCP